MGNVRLMILAKGSRSASKTDALRRVPTPYQTKTDACEPPYTNIAHLEDKS